MKKLSKLIAAVATALAITPAFASTDCYSTVTTVQYDKTAGSLTIALATGTYFAVALTDADMKTVLSIGTLSKITGASVMVRYAGTSVSCTSGGRTDMTVFLMQ